MMHNKISRHLLLTDSFKNKKVLLDDVTVKKIIFFSFVSAWLVGLFVALRKKETPSHFSFARSYYDYCQNDSS